MKKEINPAITIAIVVIVAILAGYFLFMRSDTGSVSGTAALKKSSKEETSAASPSNQANPSPPASKGNIDK